MNVSMYHRWYRTPVSNDTHRSACIHNYSTHTRASAHTCAFPQAKSYSTNAEVQTFTCSDPERTPKGTNFRLLDRGSFSNQTNQPQILPGRLSKNDGGVPTVTGVCGRRASCTRGGVSLARTGSPQRTVCRRVW